jgi:7-keto-8-aminopelargonate synthetase-like enzyme
MRKYSDYIDLSYTMFHESDRRGLMFHTAENEALNGRTITVGGQDWLNFGSCSYLGLELDERLKAGVIDAVTRYGTQFSSSRAMVSAPPYQELEVLLERVFGYPVLPAPNTSLGHIATLPVLIQEGDMMVLDQQVHMSVVNGANLARVHGAKLEVIRHNDLAQLEDIMLRERSRYRNIWYLADGLYSMYGDFAPLPGLMDLLARYEQLHLYFDDAHAMSWCGQHGRGYVLGQVPLHARMVVATSLNKAFACAGGVLLIPDDQMRSKLKTVGGPLIYSGPIHPPMLGAAVASAKVHLSEGFAALQGDLLARIQYCNEVFNTLGLPLISQDESPVRFVATGLPRVSYNMVDRLQKEGFYLNVAVFPVVPMKRAGLRFTLTRHLTLDDIRRLAEAIAHHLPLALAEEGSSLAEVHAAFGLAPGPERSVAAATSPSELVLEKYHRVQDLDLTEWDTLLGARGTFSHAGLALLEQTFTGHARPEDNWRFVYYVVRDGSGRPVLATFFTDAIWKDDMIASPEVSRLAEQRRSKDPYFLASRTLAMGSLLTEGDHLYLDRTGNWQGALQLVLADLALEQARHQAQVVVLRDLDAEDPEMEAFLLEHGFARYLMPENMVLTLDPNDSQQAYLTKLSRRSRRFVKSEVLPREGDITVAVAGAAVRPLTTDELAHLHRLYMNVQERSYEYNTFPLPEGLFERMNRSPDWEFLLLGVTEAAGAPAGDRPVAFIAGYLGEKHYVPLIVGLDYAYVASHGVYRQAIWAVIQRARALGATRICFGMGAGLEKHRFGAVSKRHAIYFQAADTYNFEVLLHMMSDAIRTPV